MTRRVGDVVLSAHSPFPGTRPRVLARFEADDRRHFARLAPATAGVAFVGLAAGLFMAWMVSDQARHAFPGAACWIMGKGGCLARPDGHDAPRDAPCETFGKGGRLCAPR